MKAVSVCTTSKRNRGGRLCVTIDHGQNYEIVCYLEKGPNDLAFARVIRAAIRKAIGCK